MSNLLTIFNMGLHILPDVEAQSTDMLAHVQKRVIREARVLMSPLGSRADAVICEVNKRHLKTSEVH